MPFARAAAWGDGEDEFDVAWVDLLMTGDADRPGKPACAQRLTELGAHAVPCVGKDCPEANAGGDQATEFGKRNLRLGPRRAILGGHAGALEPSFVAGPGLRQEQSQTDHHRDLDARQRQRHKVRQFAVLPKADAYCGATPTECAPFFGNVVSSMTRKAPAPPTSLSAWSASSRSSGASSQTPSDTKRCSRS